MEDSLALVRRRSPLSIWPATISAKESFVAEDRAGPRRLSSLTCASISVGFGLWTLRLLASGNTWRIGGPRRAAAGTVNRELAVLGRMFTLAIQGNVLTARPYLPKLKEAEPRQGFFEYSEYLAVKQNLPVEYQDVVEFGYFSGWRRGEIVTLEWRDIDQTGRVIRLRGTQSKNSQGRTLALEGPLAALIERRWRSRLVGSQLVFHRNGRPVGDWRKRWATACIKAGFFRVEPVPGKPEGRKVPHKALPRSSSYGCPESHPKWGTRANRHEHHRAQDSLGVRPI